MNIPPNDNFVFKAPAPITDRAKLAKLKRKDYEERSQRLFESLGLTLSKTPQKTVKRKQITPPTPAVNLTALEEMQLEIAKKYKGKRPPGFK
jgi:hypothetical protein